MTFDKSKSCICEKFEVSLLFSVNGILLYFSCRKLIFYDEIVNKEIPNVL